MRRTIVLLILVALAFSLVAPAWADTTYRGKSVEDLTAESHDGKVTLTWTVNVVENVGTLFGDTKVTIRRTDNPNKGWDRASVVQTIPLTEAGEVRMSWTDTSVSPGEKWYYRVSTGDVAARWKETGPVTVLATPATPEPVPGEPGQPDEPGEPDQKLEIEDQGNTLEKMIAGVVEFPCRMMEKIVEVGGFKPLNALVFQEGLSWEERKMLPWQGNEMEYLSKWYWAIAIATAPFFIIVIAVTSYRLIFAGVSVTARKEAMEAVQRWLGAVAIVALAPLMVSTLMWIVAILMDALIGAYNAVAADLGRPISDWGTVSMTGEGIHTGSVLGTAFVRVFLTGIMLYLNVLYLIRKIALTVFFAFTPIAAMIWAINKNTTAATVWLGELVSNAMMPVAHGLVLCAILIFADVKEMGHGTWVQVLIMLWTFIPLSEALRNSLQSIVARFAGFNEAGLAGSGFVAVAGLGSIAGVARVAGATFGGGRGVGVVPPSRGGNLPPGGGMPPARGGPVLPGRQPSVGWSTLAGAAPGWRAGSVDGGSPVEGYAPSPAFQRALRVGAAARQTAAVGMAAMATLALAGIPGGHLAAPGLARAAGGIAAVGAMTAHWAGSVTWRKAAPAVAKLPGVETATARVRGLAADVAASPYAQKAAGYVSTAGSRFLDVGRVVLGPAEGIRVPPRPVYRDGVTSLDAWHYQRQY